MKIFDWLRSLGKKPQPTEVPSGPTPELLQAKDFTEGEVGAMTWDADFKPDLLDVTDQGRTIEWGVGKTGSGKYSPVWVPALTCLQLHSGRFQWDFKVDQMGGAQIGVGFMLLWNVGPDWGFFGYLGASHSAWSYDPSTGDVVFGTESVEGNLPKFENGESGVVSIELDLPRQSEGEGRFVVESVKSHSIKLPVGSVIVPAACFLKQGQRVTLENFRQS